MVLGGNGRLCHLTCGIGILMEGEAIPEGPPALTNSIFEFARVNHAKEKLKMSDDSVKHTRA